MIGFHIPFALLLPLFPQPVLCAISGSRIRIQSGQMPGLSSRGTGARLCRLGEGLAWERSFRLRRPNAHNAVVGQNYFLPTATTDRGILHLFLNDGRETVRYPLSSRFTLAGRSAVLQTAGSGGSELQDTAVLVTTRMRISLVVLHIDCSLLKSGSPFHQDHSDKLKFGSGNCQRQPRDKREDRDRQGLGLVPWTLVPVRGGRS